MRKALEQMETCPEEEESLKQQNLEFATVLLKPFQLDDLERERKTIESGKRVTNEILQGFNCIVVLKFSVSSATCDSWR